LVEDAVRGRRQYVIGNHNLHSLYLLSRQPRMRGFYEQADYVHVDGMPLVLLGRLLGMQLERKHRTGYMDLLPRLLENACSKGWRIFYLGSKPEVVEKGSDILRAQYPALTLKSFHGYFDTQPGCPNNKSVLAQINEFAPHVLLVGMGMPRQETWILQNREHLRANAIFCCGALMDYVAGEIPTPPRWLGQIGLEWLYRLAAEPGRLWRRYLVEPWFVLGFLFAEIQMMKTANGEKSQSWG